jgi:hypothetical protein
MIAKGKFAQTDTGPGATHSQLNSQHRRAFSSYSSKGHFLVEMAFSLPGGF